MRNWVILALILVVVGLIGSGVTLGAMGSDGFSFGTEKVHHEERASSDGVTRIKIATGGSDVTIEQGTGDEVVAVLDDRASKKFLDRLKVELTRSGDELLVNVHASTGFSIGVNILDVDLHLTLPKRQWEQLALDGGSGNAVVTSLDADEVLLDVGSGNISMKQVIAGKAELETGSGNVTVEDAKLDRISIDASSGNMKLEEVSAGKIEAESGSGNIVMNLPAIQGDISADTGSGNITIAVDETPASALVRYSTGSGGMTNEWGGQTASGDDDDETIRIGSGEAEIKLDTGSGNIRLLER